MKSIWKFFNILAVILLAAFLGLRDVLPVSADAPFQTITILTHAPLTATDGESFTVDAVADSGLTVIYSAVGVCTNLGATFTMTSSSGICTVQYDQLGDGTYDPAPQLTEEVTAQPTVTATLTATLTPTETSTQTIGASPTNTVGASPSPSPTGTMTGTMTATATATATPTAAPTSIVTTYYVSVTGDDNNSCQSPATTCQTINAAIDKANAGNTIKVATGTYASDPPFPGSDVVRINKNLTILGGWNAAFTAQNSHSTVESNIYSTAIGLTENTVAHVDRFILQNNWLGVGTYRATLTLSNSIVRNNHRGVSNSEKSIMTINNSAIIDNLGDSYYLGGGIYNTGTLLINNTTIHNNGSSGIANKRTLTIRNSTISGNRAKRWGGGILNEGKLTIFNSTITDNTAIWGGGIVGGQYPAQTMLFNTIVAGNHALSHKSADCMNNIASGGYNLIGDTLGCSFRSTIGDLTNIAPKLGPYTGNPFGTHPLQANSPAINAGNPATPGSNQSACLTTDQRGVARPTGHRCDMGAYEYIAPGIAKRLVSLEGDDQKAGPKMAFLRPLQVVVLDGRGSPVRGVTVTFTAPASGASGTFQSSGTNQTTVVSDPNGIASVQFTGNNTFGTYQILATVSGIGTPVSFDLTNILWYVAANGNDTNDCATPTTPCASINGAIVKAGKHETILITANTYTSSGDEVVLLNKDVSLSGGWNGGFKQQNGITTIDGEGTRVGIHLSNPWLWGIPTFASIDHFEITKSIKGGIYNHHNDRSGFNLRVNHSAIHDNIGRGILNEGAILTIANSTINNNINNTGCGGGIVNSFSGQLTIINSTISGNIANDPSAGTGGGICNFYAAILLIQNTTITGNTAYSGGGIATVLNEPGDKSDQITYIGNTILAQNKSEIGGECMGYIKTVGHNLLGKVTPSCHFTPEVGDMINIADPKLGSLIGLPSYVPLLSGSPAINSSDPVTCPATDQRGVVRPQGTTCDIGAYEYKSPGSAASLQVLSGSDQKSPVGAKSAIPLKVYLVDQVGSPVSGVTVTFTAPANGPRAIFAKNGKRTLIVLTNSSGVADAGYLYANQQAGMYNITATISGLAGSANFVLENLPIPTPIAPSGKITDTIPTYRWLEVSGASNYQYQLWQNGMLVYSKVVPASACQNLACSSTPTIILSNGNYKWKIRAMLDSIWQDYSKFEPFSIIG